MLIGIGLILIPILLRLIPSIEPEKIPWLLLYVYRGDNFFFATSPLLIIIAVASLLWNLTHR